MINVALLRRFCFQLNHCRHDGRKTSGYTAAEVRTLELKPIIVRISITEQLGLIGKYCACTCRNVLSLILDRAYFCYWCASYRKLTCCKPIILAALRLSHLFLTLHALHKPCPLHSWKQKFKELLSKCINIKEIQGISKCIKTLKR